MGELALPYDETLVAELAKDTHVAGGNFKRAARLSSSVTVKRRTKNGTTLAVPSCHGGKDHKHPN